MPSSSPLPGPLAPSPVWRWALLLGLPGVMTAMVLALLLSQDTAWRDVNLRLYGAVGTGLGLCWIPLLWPRSARFSPSLMGAAAAIGGLFYVVKLSLLIWLAPPDVMVSELTQSFFWFTPMLLMCLLARELPLVRRLAFVVLSVLSALSAYYLLLHLSDPAARVACTGLTELMLASWVTYWVTSLYLPQREHQAMKSGERAALEQLAYTDLLTGLPNRLHFERELDACLEGGATSPVTLLFIDLDSFKVANDTLGHAEGDRILRSVAVLLRQVEPPGAHACRLSGDEFVLLLPGLGGSEGERLGETIQARMVHHDPDAPVHITVSIGVAVYPDDAQNASELLRHADSAMYAVKRSGKRDVRRYRQADAATERAQIIARDVPGGLRRGEFSLVYQPLFDLTSGQMTKVEALTRWQHPELGAVSPEQFIGVAEQVGSIVALGSWALREACTAALAWPQLRVCVNVSAMQVLQHDFVGEVGRALHLTGLSAERLELELTETLLMHDDAHLAGVLRELRHLGVTLCMDDFGSGHSNLSRLRTLPIQGLKMDRSFTAALIGPAAERVYPLALLEAVVGIGKLRGIEITIEGIETPQQLDWVRSLGQVTVQGYLLGRPVSAGELTALRPDVTLPAWAVSAALSPPLLGPQPLSESELG
ncbi:EAL domain-containing protein [Deinococcus sp.]|uniref:putative bifunctional diguanylate cyclase/phosphodiesterase n=1 Tax=Deinococcus sp. TaxID=47478 RepID=UPI0025CE1988|nr:EAL domain-containing protein [Deinococcus sp.]